MKFEKNITSLLYILVGISSLWDALCASSFPVSFLIYFVFKNAIKKCYVQFAWKCSFFPKQFRVLCCQEKLQISTTILHRNMEMLQLKIFENMKKQNTKRDIDFSNNCKLGVYPKFLIFNLLNVSNKDTLSIRKRLLCSVINKNFNMFQKDSVCPKCFI